MEKFINKYPFIFISIVSIFIICLVNINDIYDYFTYNEVKPKSEYQITQTVEISDKINLDMSELKISDSVLYELKTYIRSEHESAYNSIEKIKQDYGSFKQIDSLKCIRYKEAKEQIIKLEYLNNKKCN